MFLNSNNFCRWSASEEDCYYQLPLYAGDGLNIFVNYVFDDSVVPFADIKLGLYHDGIYLFDIASANQIVISGDLYSIYFDEWTVPNLPTGNYRFVIYNNPSTILYYSNSFKKVNNTEFTSIVKYNNSVDALGYLYESIPSFYNTFRIDLRTGLPNFKENATGYETYSGDFIKTKSDVQRLVEFNTRYFDDGAHEAFFSMLAHSEMLIDDVEYKKQSGEDYSITWSEFDDNKIGNGIVNLLEVDYSAAVNRC